MGLSPKQLEILKFPYTKYDALICDGAVRAGKTSIMALSFVLWAMGNFDKQQFAICGKSVGSVTRNVLNPLLSIKYLSENFQMQYNRSDHCLVVRRGSVTNNFYLFGGKDESSQDLIQGITLAGVLLDEVALMPQSFVNQALARCSVTGRKLWFNCNPANPMHWFRQEWLLQLDQKNAMHLHFTLDDNPGLSEEIKSSYRSMYSGVFYKRFIEGLWVMADGVIYDMFDANENVYRDDEKPVDLAWTGVRYIAVDYGTTNPMRFLEIYDYKGKVYIDREYDWDSRREFRQKTDSEYGDDFMTFLGDQPCSAVYVDPSAASFITELESRGLYIIQADNDVENGIRRCASLIGRRELLINSRCTRLIDEIGTYCWDTKAAMNGVERPVKTADHSCVVGETLIDTVDGPKRIDELVGKKGELYCTDGESAQIKPFFDVRMTSPDEEIFELTLENGKAVKLTANHPVLTERGWVKLQDLRMDDKVACIGGV